MRLFLTKNHELILFWYQLSIRRKTPHTFIQHKYDNSLTNNCMVTVRQPQIHGLPSCLALYFNYRYREEEALFIQINIESSPCERSE